MDLNEEQKAKVAAWFAAGESLDEIQKHIKSEFGVHVTYLDLRLMVAELPQPQDAEDEKDEGGERGSGGDGSAGAAGISETAETAGNTGSAEEKESEDGTEVPAPTVTIDALMIPGTLASGDVTFSDGKTGKWYLDQMGRLGLGGDLPQGYRPSPTDAALFQQQLMQLLQSKGLC